MRFKEGVNQGLARGRAVPARGEGKGGGGEDPFNIKDFLVFFDIDTDFEDASASHCPTNSLLGTDPAAVDGVCVGWVGGGGGASHWPSNSLLGTDRAAVVGLGVCVCVCVYICVCVCIYVPLIYKKVVKNKIGCWYGPHWYDLWVLLVFKNKKKGFQKQK